MSATPSRPTALPYISPGSERKQFLPQWRGCWTMGCWHHGKSKIEPKSKHPLVRKYKLNSHMYLWCLQQAEAAPPMACPQSTSPGQQTGLLLMPVAVGTQVAPALKTGASQGRNQVCRQSTGSIRTTLHPSSCIWLGAPAALWGKKDLFVYWLIIHLFSWNMSSLRAGTFSVCSLLKLPER